MKKAILIINEPKACIDCDFYKRYYADEYEVWDNACFILEEIIDSDIAEEKRHERCPLRLMPEKISALDVPGKYKDFGNAFSLAKGYNACIDELEGSE